MSTTATFLSFRVFSFLHREEIKRELLSTRCLSPCSRTWSNPASAPGLKWPLRFSVNNLMVRLVMSAREYWIWCLTCDLLTKHFCFLATEFRNVIHCSVEKFLHFFLSVFINNKYTYISWLRTEFATPFIQVSKYGIKGEEERKRVTGKISRPIKISRLVGISKQNLFKLIGPERSSAQRPISKTVSFPFSHPRCALICKAIIEQSRR